MRCIREKYIMEFDITFTDKEITPWGGMVFLNQILQKNGFKEVIKNSSDLPQFTL